MLRKLRPSSSTENFTPLPLQETSPPSQTLHEQGQQEKTPSLCRGGGVGAKATQNALLQKVRNSNSGHAPQKSSSSMQTTHGSDTSYSHSSRASQDFSIPATGMLLSRSASRRQVTYLNDPFRNYYGEKVNLTPFQKEDSNIPYLDPLLVDDYRLGDSVEHTRIRDQGYLVARGFVNNAIENASNKSAPDLQDSSVEEWEAVVNLTCQQFTLLDPMRNKPTEHERKEIAVLQAHIDGYTTPSVTDYLHGKFGKTELAAKHQDLVSTMLSAFNYAPRYKNGDLYGVWNVGQQDIDRWSTQGAAGESVSHKDFTRAHKSAVTSDSNAKGKQVEDTNQTVAIEVVYKEPKTALDLKHFGSIGGYFKPGTKFSLIEYTDDGKTKTLYVEEAEGLRYSPASVGVKAVMFGNKTIVPIDYDIRRIESLSSLGSAKSDIEKVANDVTDWRKKIANIMGAFSYNNPNIKLLQLDQMEGDLKEIRRKIEQQSVKTRRILNDYYSKQGEYLEQERGIEEEIKDTKKQLRKFSPKWLKPFLSKETKSSRKELEKKLLELNESLQNMREFNEGVKGDIEKADKEASQLEEMYPIVLDEVERPYQLIRRNRFEMMQKRMDKLRTISLPKDMQERVDHYVERSKKLAAQPPQMITGENQRDQYHEDLRVLHHELDTFFQNVRAFVRAFVAGPEGSSMFESSEGESDTSNSLNNYS